MNAISPIATHPENGYLNLLRELLEKFERVQSFSPDRTTVGTVPVLGRELRFSMADGFPLLTTKKVAAKTAWKEILWMLNGGRNIRDLLVGRPRCTIWTDWPLKNYRESTGETISQADFEDRIIADAAFAQQWGDLGPVYGVQWRAWDTPDGRRIDQVAQCIETLKKDPYSRRNFWTGWNVGDIDEMARSGLPPCHVNYYWYVEDGRLSLHIWQRSADVFLGVPFNICNGALLLHIFADHVGLMPDQLVWYGANVHLYSTHLDAAREQLQNTPRDFPSLVFRTRRDTVFDYTHDDFEVQGYDPHQVIRAPIAV